MMKERHNHRILISGHARDQAVLRIPNVSFKDSNGLISKMYYNGLNFGAAFGNDFLLEYPVSDQFFVLVCEKYIDNKKYDVVIKTVLTKEQAIINMEHVFCVKFQGIEPLTKNQTKKLRRNTCSQKQEYLDFLRKRRKK